MENNQHIPSRNVQTIGGLLMALVSLGFIVWTWLTALNQGYFYPKAAMIFPPFFFVGLGLIIFPDYKTERIERGENIANLSGLKLLTLRWWIILILGLLAGFVNFLLLKFM